jgi:hypothetical protein
MGQHKLGASAFAALPSFLPQHPLKLFVRLNKLDTNKPFTTAWRSHNQKNKTYHGGTEDTEKARRNQVHRGGAENIKSNRQLSGVRKSKAFQFPYDVCFADKISNGKGTP